MAKFSNFKFSRWNELKKGDRIIDEILREARIQILLTELEYK
jgi:hypothetical protein